MSGHVMDAGRSQVLVIDVQERLAPAMEDTDQIVGTCAFLAKVAGLLSVPVLITEQYPKGLGGTLTAITQAATKPAIVSKTAFSAAREPKVMDRLRKKRGDQRRDQAIICGIESHVCVLQTALDLKESGFEVFVVADAITSRRLGSRDVALSRMAHAGIIPVTSEMVAFEWMGDASHKAFKAISALVRDR
ncbi:MAG: hydrolase [Pseudomonadota bacterium]